MLKFIRILYLKWRIADLKSELGDYRAILDIRSHYLHSSEIDTNKLFQIKKIEISKHIIRLQRKIIQIKNTRYGF